MPSIIIQVDNIWGRILNAPNKLYSILRREMRYRPTGYMFSRAYEYTGGWRYVISKGLKFRVGFLRRVKNILSSHNYEYTVIYDGHPPCTSVDMPSDINIDLRPYQKDALRAFINYSEPAMFCVLPTGSGKTAVAAACIHAIKRKTMFLVNANILLFQAQRILEHILGIPVGIIGAGRCDVHDVNVATVQTLIRALSGASNSDIKRIINETEMVVVDEAHSLASDMLQDVTKHFKHVSRLLMLTASDYRADGNDMLLEGIGGMVGFRVPFNILASDGYVISPTIKRIKVGPTDKTLGTYQNVFKKQVIENDSRTKLIIDMATEYSNADKSVIIAVNQVNHGKRIMSMLNSNNCEELYGVDDTDDRTDILTRLDNKDIKILVTTLAKEGLDIPSLDCLIEAYPTKDDYQLVGRTVRIADGKTEATIFDLCDDVPYLEKHAKYRSNIHKYYQFKEEQYERT